MAATRYPAWVRQTGLHHAIDYMHSQVDTGVLSQRFQAPLEAFVFEEYRRVVEQFIGMTEARVQRQPEREDYRDSLVVACRQQVARLRTAARKAPSAKQRAILEIHRQAWERMARFAEQLPAARTDLLAPPATNRDSQRLRAICRAGAPA
jgi:hypothetical protein